MEFTYNGVVYRRNEETGRYGKTENGKTRRIGKTEYEQAHDAWMAGAMERAEAEDASEEREAVFEALEDERPRNTAHKRKARTGGVEFDGDGIHVVLTPRQVEFICQLPATQFWTDGVDSAVWIDVLCDDIGGQFDGRPMAVGAMVSTLREKHLLVVFTAPREGAKGRYKYFVLTEAGKTVVGAVLSRARGEEVE